MASETVILYVLGLPLIGAAAAWITGLRAWRTVPIEIRSASRTGPTDSTAKARWVVMMVLPATLVLFGYAMFFLLTRGGVGDVLASAAALAYGASGFLTSVGIAIVLHFAVAPAARDRAVFGPAVTFAALAEVAALCGFATAFLILQTARGYTGDAQALLAASERAALYISTGALGAPLAAYLSVRSYGFGGARSFARGTILGSLGIAPTLLSLLLAFNALSAVS